MSVRKRTVGEVGTVNGTVPEPVMDVPNSRDRTAEKIILWFTMTGLYGMVISILGLVMPLTYFLNLWSEKKYGYIMVFYIYVYVASIVFMIYAFISAYLTKKEHGITTAFDCWKAQTQKDGKDVPMQEVNGVAQRAKDALAADAIRHQENKEHAHEWTKEGRAMLPPLGQSPEGLNLYIKAGLIFFAAMSVVLDILGVIGYIEDDRTFDCYYGFMIAVFILRIIFIILEVIFILSHHKTLFNFNRPVMNLGFVQLMSTNICTWGFTILLEATESYVHAFYSHDSSHDSSHSSSHSSGHGTTTTASHHATTSSSNNLVECTKLDTSFAKVSAYMFPFMIEFSLIAAGVLYKMYSNIGTMPEERKVKLLREEDLHLLHKPGACCSPSLGGLLGNLIVLICFITTLIYVLLKEGIIHDTSNATSSIYYAINIPVLIITIGAVIWVLFKTCKLHFVEEVESAFDEVLLLVSLGGVYFLYGFAIVADANYVKHEEWGKWAILDVIFCVCIFVQSTIQVLFIRDGLRRRIVTRRQLMQKPGRSLVAFMYTSNFAMWVLSSFMLKQIANSEIITAFYGKLAWVIIVNLFLPLSIFFRFHSGECIADIYEATYYEDCYLGNRRITTGVWELACERKATKA